MIQRAAREGAKVTKGWETVLERGRVLRPLSTLSGELQFPRRRFEREGGQDSFQAQGVTGMKTGLTELTG